LFGSLFVCPRYPLTKALPTTETLAERTSESMAFTKRRTEHEGLLQQKPDPAAASSSGIRVKVEPGDPETPMKMLKQLERTVNTLTGTYKREKCLADGFASAYEREGEREREREERQRGRERWMDLLQRRILCTGGSPAEDDLMQKRIFCRGGSPAEDDLMQRRILCRGGTPAEEDLLQRMISCRG